MKRVYLGGPINKCSDSEAKDWPLRVRRSVKPTPPTPAPTRSQPHEHVASRSLIPRGQQRQQFSITFLTEPPLSAIVRGADGAQVLQREGSAVGDWFFVIQLKVADLVRAAAPDAGGKGCAEGNQVFQGVVELRAVLGRPSPLKVVDAFQSLVEVDGLSGAGHTLLDA